MTLKLLGKMVGCVVLLLVLFKTQNSQPLNPSTTQEAAIYKQYSNIRLIDWYLSNNKINRITAIQKETKFPIEIVNKIVEASNKYHFEDEVIVGLIQMESEYDVNATNFNDDSVDMGLLQINSNTLPWLAAKINKPNADPYNPIDAIELGSWYLSYLRSQCDGALYCALARYNGDSTGRYQQEATRRIDQVASRMGIERKPR